MRNPVIKLSRDLSLPIDAITQTFGFIARKGAGKTYAAGVLVEGLLSVGAQVIVIDPIGNWYGLRLDRDGVAPGIDIPILGGLRGDIPLEVSGGAKVAATIVESGGSAVIDVSQFSKAKRKQFVADFAECLFMLKKANPGPVHLVLEEAQLFAPQRTQKGEERMLGAIEDIVRLGRNFGIGTSLISQRPQSINKEVLNQVECLVLLQVNGAHERKAIEQWVVDNSVDVGDMVKELPSLPVGTAFVWSPQWLRITRKVKIGQKRTYDGSSTPTFNTESVTPGKLDASALAKLETAMSDTIERQKANDPKVLKKRITNLEAQLAKAEQITTAEPDTAALDAAWHEGRRHAIKFATEIIANGFHNIPNELRAQADRLDEDSANVKKALMSSDERPERQELKAPRPSSPPTYRKPVETKQSGDITKPQQRILDALAQLADVHIVAPTRIQVAFLAGSSPKSSGYTNNLSALRTRGYVAYPDSGCLGLTFDGTVAANQPETVLTTKEFQDLVYSKLSNPRARIIQVVVSQYPNSISRDQLAEFSYFSPKSSGYTNNISALRTLGLLDYPSNGHVVATDIMFLGGS